MPETQFHIDQNPADFSSHQLYDVAIVGAGPVGLATAIGLQKRGIENIIVLDQTKAFRQVGHGVDLLPNGLKALKWIDPEAYEAVKQTGFKFLTLRNQTANGVTKIFREK
jgi:2-polyprenyl-6-methoxyphenol hydroxylase-like FAD-dependent oxidoreductase